MYYFWSIWYNISRTATIQLTIQNLLGPNPKTSIQKVVRIRKHRKHGDAFGAFPIFLNQICQVEMNTWNHTGTDWHVITEWSIQQEGKTVQLFVRSLATQQHESVPGWSLCKQFSITIYFNCFAWILRKKQRVRTSVAACGAYEFQNQGNYVVVSRWRLNAWNMQTPDGLWTWIARNLAW